ncbi:MAG TPA: hypothetical protein PKC76_04280 [Saprospiraceae bacterium]|nr:hypothetical protein [Saprospiraceae bacterium]HMO38246.1 hypothetical protein [Saprospiraceae bacterium]HMP23319.1 hypothetical protein [Saprospiraceae bacterium]HMP23321.1 hypothetical protein [Saprospiraceae bacterium]
MKKILVSFVLSAVLMVPFQAFAEHGTLMGNANGDKYCCCPGTNDCFASACPDSYCEDEYDNG